MAKFLIVEARFYDHLNDMLVAGAKNALKAKGHEVEVITVPGALEIPGTIAMAAEAQLYDGFVAIGVVIRGRDISFRNRRWRKRTWHYGTDHGRHRNRQWHIDRRE